MSKRKSPSPYRPGQPLAFHITVKDIAAGGTTAQIVARAIGRKYGIPVPRRIVQAALAVYEADLMSGRVRHVIACMKKAGHLTKCGRYWHIGTARTGFASVEAFDMETVIDGEPPALLPKGDGPTYKFTMSGVELYFRSVLEEKDREAAGLAKKGRA